MFKVEEFRARLKELSREELLSLLEEQSPELRMQVNRIEYVFSHNLRHLSWGDGSQIKGRPLTVDELALLFDPPFEPDPDLTRAGISIDQQRQIHIANDPVTWAKTFLKTEPYVYQILMLRHPKRRKILRAGRRLGKTHVLALMILHYCFTHNDGRVLVLTPMKSQSQVIYEEMMKLVRNSDVAFDQIKRNVTSPYHEVDLKNGSTVRFFSTGLKTGGKSDVARGQEAHLIILDELDYMGPEDLDAIYAMLQKTPGAKGQKTLVGASTPTGRREKFWEWCTDGVRRGRFAEFWFPSYCNPLWDRETEEEMREEYKNPMVYRHEIEADWGEDLEGVYPRRWVDIACNYADYGYTDRLPEGPHPYGSFYVMGVDWDKYGAGVNIIVLQVCTEDYDEEEYDSEGKPLPDFRSKIRVVWREETQREEYALTRAVDRIKELNLIFQPRHIYVDRGYGEVQVELLHKHGVEVPESQLKKRVKGVSFSENMVMRDPATKQEVKKEIKPFMVDNLRQMLEAEQIVIPKSDELLFRQLIGYIVVRTTVTGREVFEGGEAGDHAHDALILACLAITQNYGDLMRLRLATHSRAISNEAFIPLFDISENDSVREKEEKIVEEVWGDPANAPLRTKRAMAGRIKSNKPIRRSSF
ncbi:MAG TPA: terminase family protein [Nitrososphaera sp.]|nr:terminase family protein [Nitrososphaera sp.]